MNPDTQDHNTTDDHTNFSNQMMFTSTESIDDDEPSQGPKWPDILGVAIIVLLLIGIATTLFDGKSDSQDQVAQTGATIMNEDGDVQAIEVTGDEEDADALLMADRSGGTTAGSDTASNVSAPAPTTDTALTSSVKLALLAEPGSVAGLQRGCDVVYFAPREIIPTRAPLNAALRELFRKDLSEDAQRGNFIATQPELMFDKATLEDGVAHIYLTGQVGPYNGTCDESRAFTQIKETALQFSTVTGVVIYLDGQRLGY